MNFEDLKELRRQLSYVISCYETGRMHWLVDMTDLEKLNHLTKYGDNAATIGDFIIRKRVPLPWDGWAKKIPLDR